MISCNLFGLVGGCTVAVSMRHNTCEFYQESLLSLTVANFCTILAYF